ncbi:MAG: hypothetical protein K2Y37_02945 [Pirellulales bacterium]|nr:hypothetical protein [Pirellulales bacterium]
MYKVSRVLSPDFRAFMSERRAWPLTEEFVHSVRARGKTIRSDVYTNMKRGAAVAPHFAALLAQYFIDKVAAGEPTDDRAAAFLEFIRARGIVEPASHSARALAEHLLEQERDLLADGVPGLLEALCSQTNSEAPPAPTKRASQVRQAVRWMYAYLARAVSPDANHLTAAKAIQTAEAMIGIALNAYEARAIDWWRTNPWTVNVVRGRRAAVGMTIVLPLTAEAYHEIRAGKRMASEVGVSDLQFPTRHVFLEGFAQRSAVDSGLSGDPTRYLALAIDSQVGALCTCPDRLAEPLHILNRVAFPLSEVRAKGYQFRPTGNYEHKSGQPLWELVVKPASSGQEALLSGILISLGLRASNPNA